MENSPLNKAHQLERRAEAFLKQRKFDESVEAYSNAVMYLLDSLNLTENPRSRESIQLQIERHHKQIDNIKIKKVQHEEHRRHQEVLKNRAKNFSRMYDDGESLQTKIFRTMETHDSLIEVLIKRGNTDEESLKSYSTSDTDEKGSTTDACDGLKISGKKRQVDDSTIIEEFRELCDKLREFVKILLEQLEARDSEIEELKSKIDELENEKDKANSKGNTLKVVTDSSGGTSPYVYSPCSELSPEVQDVRDLSSLPPLDMPSLNLLNMITNTNSMNLNGN